MKNHSTPQEYRLEEGQIVIFRVEGELICHRLVMKVKDRWVTRGDNNPVADTRALSRENYRGLFVEKL